VINTLRPLKTIYLRVYAFNSLIPSGIPGVAVLVENNLVQRSKIFNHR